MDELPRMRFELEQLKEKEQHLQEALSRVRVEIEAHSSRIEHIAWTKAPINSLPSEILSYVLELATLSRGDNPYFKILDLQLVSRYWRDNIRNFPKFWSRIYLFRSTNMSFVRTHLTRSNQYPLDIAIQFGLGVNDDQITTSTDIIVSHVHRWRTLKIGGSDRCFQIILDKINHLKFPSLTHVVMRTDRFQPIQYPAFLRPDNSPSLKSLRIYGLIPMDEFSPGQTFGQKITDLSLVFTEDVNRLEPLTLPSLLSSQRLTTVDLTYSRCPALSPNSISLPLLNSLTLRSNYPRELLTAMVAPKLSYFSLTDVITPLPIFHRLESKFCNVRHLVLRFGLSVADTQSVPLAFPNVHNVELEIEQVDDFFEPNPEGSCAVDRWRSLQSLTFHEMDIDSTPYLERWLRRWKTAGLPMLRVKFVDCVFRSHSEEEEDYSTPRSLLHFHNQLRGVCILDIVDDTLHTTQQVSSQTSSPSLSV